MGLFDAIRNKDLHRCATGFRELKKECEKEVLKAFKRHGAGLDFEDRKEEIEDRFYSAENFGKVLPADEILRIRKDMMNEMIISENTLYTFNDIILKRLSGDHYTNFSYTGKCAECNLDTERKIPVKGPVMDYEFINNPFFFNQFYEDVKCDSCGSPTEPVKTRNIFELKDENEYGVKYLLVRMKSRGGIIPKFVEKCSGKQKDMRDICGFTAVCRTEDDCKKLPGMLIKYHKDNRIECRDYFEVKKGKSGECENATYHLALNKKGELKKEYKKEPLEMKIRITDKWGKPVKFHEYFGMDREEIELRGILWNRYRAIHVPIEYEGVVIESQIKDLWNYSNESNPKSPIFHGLYRMGKDGRIMHTEERTERKIRTGWGTFERRLEDFLEKSGIFDGHSPDLYL